MKKRVGLLFGGMSAEHEVSLKSAKAIYNNIDKNKFELVPIFINKSGLWSIQDISYFQTGILKLEKSSLFLPWSSIIEKEIECDIYFPILHGPNGEDGKVQSLIELSQKPLVGANSFGSALAMDKTVSKKLFMDAGLNVVKSLLFNKNDPVDKILKDIVRGLKLPVFIKPNSLGSSVGISKAGNKTEILNGINDAFKYDNKIIVEEGLNVREIEVSVIGNDILEVSKPGELKPGSVFYDYNDKYINGKTEFDIPAILDFDIENKIVEMAKIAFKALYLNGMARVDFFIQKENEKIYINEINTIPGFTEISMFPKLWGTVGLSFKNLITRLIELGFEHNNNKV